METVINIIRRYVSLYGKRNTLITFGIASLLGGALWWEAREFLRRKELRLKDPRFLILLHDVPTNRAIDFADLNFVTEDNLHAKPDADSLTDQDLAFLNGVRTRNALARGTVLKRSFFLSVRGLSPQIPRGKRAYVAHFSDPVFGRPGDRVDVYRTSEDVSDPPRVLIEDVRLLGADGDEAVLALSREEIELMEKAHQSSKLTLVLRNPEEPAPRGEKLYPFSRTSRKKAHIEIHSENE
jgi:Flp pilus assembly protein CpaB